MTHMPSPAVVPGSQPENSSGSNKEQHATSSSSIQASPFAHLSLTRFSDLIRTIDSASSSTGKHHHNNHNKRRRVEDISSYQGPGSRTARPLGIAEWAKAKAELRLQHRANIEPSRKGRAVGFGKASAAATATVTPSSSSSSICDPSPAASSYAPFSKTRLLQRLGSYSLSTYNVRVAIPLGATASTSPSSSTNKASQQFLASLSRWLEPVGPALNGWQQNKGGKRNELHCPTCTSSTTMAEQVDTVELLLQEVRSLQEGHQKWCPWIQRSCHPSLYALQGIEEGFVGRLSRPKARRVFRDLVASVEDSITAEALIHVPSGVTEESLKALQMVLIAHDSALKSASSDGSPGPPPPSLSAIQLALCGWLPAGNGPGLPPGLSLRPSSGKILQCRSCNRKLTTSGKGLTTPEASINPIREHRRFCPWVQGEVQSGSYLPPFASVPAAATAGQGEGEVADQIKDGSNRARPATEPVLRGFQAASAQLSQESLLRSASRPAGPPGWLLNLRALLPSSADVEGTESSPATSLDSTDAAQNLPYRPEEIRPNEQLAASRDPSGRNTLVRQLYRRSGEGGKDDDGDVDGDRDAPKRKKRNSEILREARSLLFGSGGDDDDDGGGWVTSR